MTTDMAYRIARSQIYKEQHLAKKERIEAHAKAMRAVGFKRTHDRKKRQAS